MKVIRVDRDSGPALRPSAESLKALFAFLKIRFAEIPAVLSSGRIVSCRGILVEAYPIPSLKDPGEFFGNPLMPRDAGMNVIDKPSRVRKAIAGEAFRDRRSMRREFEKFDGVAEVTTPFGRNVACRLHDRGGRSQPANVVIQSFPKPLPRFGIVSLAGSGQPIICAGVFGVFGQDRQASLTLLFHAGG